MRPGTLSRQEARRSLSESTVVEVECLEFRELGFDRKWSESTFEVAMSLVKHKKKDWETVSLTTEVVELGDGRKKTFMEPRCTGNRRVLTAPTLEFVAVRCEIIEKKTLEKAGKRWGSPPRTARNLAQHKVGVIDVVPWLQTDDGSTYRWCRLKAENTTAKQPRCEIRLRATALVGTGDPIVDVSSVVDEMQWFRQTPEYCCKAKNVVKIAIVRSRAGFSESRPCVVEIESSKGEKFATRPSATGLFLEWLTVKLPAGVRKPDDLKIRVATVTGSRVVLGESPLRTFTGKPSWVDVGPIGILIAARLDYDEQLDDYSGRPFFDDEVVLSDRKDQQLPVNALRVVVARGRGPLFRGSADDKKKDVFTATASAFGEQLSTRPVPLTQNDEMHDLCWDECFEFKLPTTTTKDLPEAAPEEETAPSRPQQKKQRSILPGVDDTDSEDEDDERDSVMFQKLNRPTSQTALLTTTTKTPLKQETKKVEVVVTSQQRGEVAKFVIETSTAQNHVVMKKWHKSTAPGGELLVATLLCHEASLDDGASREVAFSQLKIAFPELSEDVISRVLDSTRDVEDACAALGTLCAGEDPTAAFANSTDMEWSFAYENREEAPYYGLVLDDLLVDIDEEDDGEEEKDYEYINDAAYDQLFSRLDEERKEDIDEFAPPPPPPPRDYKIPSETTKAVVPPTRLMTTSQQQKFGFSKKKKNNGAPVRPVALVRCATQASVLQGEHFQELLKYAKLSAIQDISIAKHDEFAHDKSSRPRINSSVVNNKMHTPMSEERSSSLRARPSDLRSSQSSLRTSTASMVTSVGTESADDGDPRRRRRKHRFAVRVRTAFLDLDGKLDPKFDDSPFEFAQLEVDVVRTPRDFVMLKTGLTARLGLAHANLPPLPGWVQQALKVKQKASNVATAAGAASLSIAASLAVVTGTAPLIAVAGSVMLAAGAAAGTRKVTIAKAEHDINPDCTWLMDVVNALRKSTAPKHDLHAATLYLKLFLSHNGKCAVYQKPRQNLGTPQPKPIRKSNKPILQPDFLSPPSFEESQRHISVSSQQQKGALESTWKSIIDDE